MIRGLGLSSRQMQVIFLLYRVETGSGIHPVFYPMGTSDISRRCKAAGAMELTTHLHLVSNLSVGSAIHPLPYRVCIFVAWRLIKHKDIFTFNRRQ
jgi:hypothetical protein